MDSFSRNKSRHLHLRPTGHRAAHAALVWRLSVAFWPARKAAAKRQASSKRSHLMRLSERDAPHTCCPTSAATAGSPWRTAAPPIGSRHPAGRRQARQVAGQAAGADVVRRRRLAALTAAETHPTRPGSFQAAFQAALESLPCRPGRRRHCVCSSRGSRRAAATKPEERVWQAAGVRFPTAAGRARSQKSTHTLGSAPP
jgi:hypothetical protein